MESFWRPLLRAKGVGGALAILVAAIVVVIAIPAHVWLGKTLPLSARSGRHLRPDQKIRMTAALELSPQEQYAVQINCIANCEECEVFAEELRNFFTTIAGWNVSGGTLTVADTRWRHGLYLVTNSNETDIAPVEKIRSAFSSAGIVLIAATDDVRQGTFAIVVGRPQP
jgi:hypothetical protein